MGFNRKTLVEMSEGKGGIAEGVFGGSAAAGIEQLPFNPAAVIRQGTEAERFRIIGRPGEALTTELAEGDLLVRMVEGGSAHVSTVASRGLVEASELANLGLKPDLYLGGQFAHVTERAPAFRPASEGFARRVTDTAGRLLEDLLILRLATMPTTPASPTVVRVEQPPATTDRNASATASTEPAAITGAVGQAEPEDELSCNHIDASQVSWPGASAAQQNFMQRVYLRQVRAACQTITFVADVSDSELSEIESGVKARREVAAACKQLLASARTALSSDPSAAGVSAIGVLSGYRSASTQLKNWNSNFPKYFGETASDRTSADGGELGDAAAALLTRYISRRLAAPGFSLHNNGRAIDFFSTENGRTLGASTREASRRGWRSSWLFGWLTANANEFGFFQNTAIDEPWHWEFRGSSIPSQSVEASLYRFDAEDASIAPTDIRAIKWPGPFTIQLPFPFTVGASKLPWPFTLGIDVSTQTPDWTKVSNVAGEPVAFAIVQATYGKSTTPVSTAFAKNWPVLATTSLFRGAYHFFDVTVPGDDQAQHFIETIETAGGLKGQRDLPPALDFEHETDGKKYKHEPKYYKDKHTQILNWVKVWLEKVEAHFKCRPIIYTNSGVEGFWNLFNVSDCAFLKDYFLWVSHYKNSTGEPVSLPDVKPVSLPDVSSKVAPNVPPIWSSSWTLWQYQGNATGTPGLPTGAYADLNVCRVPLWYLAGIKF
jgi:GH25 family lysozyme M1 (1,4-beta-N-acetylmuramidase)/LAS superfamily LD-carboxypeptidase LdcB